jgi:hypothetical protein
MAGTTISLRLRAIAAFEPFFEIVLGSSRQSMDVLVAVSEFLDDASEGMRP